MENITGENSMCGGPTGSGTGGGSGSGSDLNSYSGTVSNMSKGEKLDKLDLIDSKLNTELRQLFNDVRSGNIKAGSQIAINETERIQNVSRQVEIARDSVRGQSKSALEYKYNTSRSEGSKTSKSEIEEIRKKWG